MVWIPPANICTNAGPPSTLGNPTIRGTVYCLCTSQTIIICCTLISPGFPPVISFVKTLRFLLSSRFPDRALFATLVAKGSSSQCPVAPSPLGEGHSLKWGVGSARDPRRFSLSFLFPCSFDSWGSLLAFGFHTLDCFRFVLFPCCFAVWHLSLLLMFGP